MAARLPALKRSRPCSVNLLYLECLDRLQDIRASAIDTQRLRRAIGAYHSIVYVQDASVQIAATQKSLNSVDKKPASHSYD